MRLLTETVVSPTLAAQLEALPAALPEARWHQYEPVGHFHTRAGAQFTFGQDVNTIYRFANADIILALAPTPLTCEFGKLRDVHDLAEQRRLWAGQTAVNRLYVVDSSPSSTQAMADRRFPVRASEIDSIVRAIAVRLGVPASPPICQPTSFGFSAANSRSMAGCTSP